MLKRGQEAVEVLERGLVQEPRNEVMLKLLESAREGLEEDATNGEPLQEGVDPYDAKLMKEIMKYNQKANNPPSTITKPGPKPVKTNIDMERMNELFKIAHNLPKIELHAHIGGCYRP